MSTTKSNNKFELIEEKNEKKGEKDEDKLNLQQVIKKIIEYLGPGLKYILMGICCIIILAIFSKAAFDKPDVVFLKKYTYLMTICIPLLLLIFLFLRKSNLDSNVMMGIGGVITFVIIVILIAYYKTPISNKTNNIVIYSYIINLIIIGILIVGLAIGYNILKNSARKMKGWPGFIINFLFFIPCLLSDFVDYILSEFKNGPPAVFILFMLEIILILLYIYIPKIWNYIINKNGITLQKDPVILNRNTILSNNDFFLLPNSLTNSISSDISSNIYNSNFGLSMWIYVNNMGSNVIQTNGSVLFKIASPNNTHGKPCIRYMGNDEWNFIFNENLKSSSDNKTNYILKIPSQKWNHVVFNYYENNVDLFINGNLERNMDLKWNPLRYLPTDIISVGDADGIDGAICNVKYYNNPLTQTKISQIYNMYIMKNPPL